MRYLAIVEYCGKNYCGWQRQLNAPSIQERLETAASGLFGADTAMTASGRTDAGVHAAGQAVSFWAETAIPAESLPPALNARLPEDIRVKSCRAVPDGFNARFSAKRKTYIYKAYISPVQSALRRDFYARIPPPFDAEAARKAAGTLVGTHDFRAFSAAGGAVKGTVRTVYSAQIRTQNDEVFIEITGNGFLYNMVRIIAGTLIGIGQGKLPADTAEAMLKTGDRTLGGKTFPPQGLYLAAVEYE